MLSRLAGIARASCETSRARDSRLKRRRASPLNDGTGPGEAAAEHDHQNVIAAFDSPGAVRFIERNRYSGSRGIAVSIEVHEHFVARNAESIGDRLHDW